MSRSGWSLALTVALGCQEALAAVKHRALAAAMSYADHEIYELERLASERAAAARRALRS